MQPALKHKHGTRSQLLPSFVQQQLLGSWLWDKPQWPVCIADMKHPLYLTATQNYNHQYSPVILTSLSTMPFIFHGTFLQQLYNMSALAVPATPIQTKKTLSMLKTYLFTPDISIAVFLEERPVSGKVCAFYIAYSFTVHFFGLKTQPVKKESF